MKILYINFSNLKESEHRSHYDIIIKNRNSNFLIFTPHGGGIEQGASEICNSIANNIYSSYIFEGKLRRNCKRLHITSHKYDEPKLIELLLKHKYAVSIHGMKNQAKKEIGADIYLGGRNKDLIGITTKILRERNFETTNNLEMPDSTLCGIDPQNVTNKCSNGAGMQIEISENLRAKFFVKDFRRSRNRKKEKTETFYAFCDAISSSIANFT